MSFVTIFFGAFRNWSACCVCRLKYVKYVTKTQTKLNVYYVTKAVVVC